MTSFQQQSGGFRGGSMGAPLAYSTGDTKMASPRGRAALKAERYPSIEDAMCTNSLQASAPRAAQDVIMRPWNEDACLAACRIVAIRNKAERNHDFANAPRNPAGLSRGSLDETRLLWRRHYFTEQETEWLLNYGFPTLPLNAVVVKAAPRTPSKKKAFAKRTAEEKNARQARVATATALARAKKGTAAKKAQKKHAQATRKWKSTLKKLGTVAVLPGDVITFNIIDARDTAALLKRAITHVDQRVAGMRIRDGKDVEVERDNIIIISYQTAPNAYPEMSLYDLLIYHNNSPTFVRGPGGALAGRLLREQKPVKNFIKDHFVYFPTVSALLDEVKMAMRDSFSMLRCMRVNTQCSRVRVIFWLISEEVKQLQALLAKPLFTINNNNPVMYVNDASALSKALMASIMQRLETSPGRPNANYEQYGYDVYSIASGNDPGTKTCITGDTGLISTAMRFKLANAINPAEAIHRCAMNANARAILQKLFGTAPVPESVAVKVFEPTEKIVTPTSITGGFASLRWTPPGEAAADQVFTWELPRALIPLASARTLKNNGVGGALPGNRTPLRVNYSAQATEIRSVSGAALLADFLALAPDNSFLTALRPEAEFQIPRQQSRASVVRRREEMIERLLETGRVPDGDPRSLLETVAGRSTPAVAEHSTNLVSQIWYPEADGGPVTPYPNLVADAIKEGGDHFQADAARAMGLFLVTADRAAGAGAILAGASVVTIRKVPSTAPPISGGEYGGEYYMVAPAQPEAAAGAGTGILTWPEALGRIKNNEGGRWASLTAASGRRGLTAAQKRASAAIRAVINFQGVPESLKGPSGWKKFKRLIRKGVNKTNIAAALWKGAKNLSTTRADRLWGLVKAATAYMKPGGPVRPRSWLGSGERKQATVCVAAQLAAAASGAARSGFAPTAALPVEYQQYKPGAVRLGEGVDPTSKWGSAVDASVHQKGLGSLAVRQGGGGPLPVHRLTQRARSVSLVEDKSIPGISTTTWGLIENYLNTAVVFGLPAVGARRHGTPFQPGKYTREVLMNDPQWVDIFRLGLRVEVVKPLPTTPTPLPSRLRRAGPDGSLSVAGRLETQLGDVILLNTKSETVDTVTYLHGKVLSSKDSPHAKTAALLPHVRAVTAEGGPKVTAVPYRVRETVDRHRRLLPATHVAEGRSGWFVAPRASDRSLVPIPEYYGNYTAGFSPCVAVFCSLLRTVDDQLEFARKRFIAKIGAGDLPGPDVLARSKTEYISLFEKYMRKDDPHHQLVKMARYILGSVEPENWVVTHSASTTAPVVEPAPSLRQIFLGPDFTGQEELANTWLFTCAFFAILHCCTSKSGNCIQQRGNYGGYIEGVTELKFPLANTTTITFRDAWKLIYSSAAKGTRFYSTPLVAAVIDGNRCVKEALNNFLRLTRDNYYNDMRDFVRAHEAVTRAALQIENYPLPYKSVPITTIRRDPRRRDPRRRDARRIAPHNRLVPLRPTLNTSAMYNYERHQVHWNVDNLPNLFNDPAFRPPDAELYQFIIEGAVSKEPLYPGAGFQEVLHKLGSVLAVGADRQVKRTEELSKFFTGRFVQLCSAVGTVLNAIINQAGVVLQSDFFPPLNLLSWCAPTPRKIFAMGAAVDTFEGLYVQGIAPSAAEIAPAVAPRHPPALALLWASAGGWAEKHRLREAHLVQRAMRDVGIQRIHQPAAHCFFNALDKYFGREYAESEERQAVEWGTALAAPGSPMARGRVAQQQLEAQRVLNLGGGPLYILLANAILGLLGFDEQLSGSGELTMMWKCVISAAHALNEREQRWGQGGGKLARSNARTPSLDVTNKGYSVEMDILSTICNPATITKYVFYLREQIEVNTKRPAHDMTIEPFNVRGIDPVLRVEIARYTLHQEYNLWAHAKNAEKAAQKSEAERTNWPQPPFQILPWRDGYEDLAAVAATPDPIGFVSGRLAAVLNEEANQEATVARFLTHQMAITKMQMNKSEDPRYSALLHHKFVRQRTALAVLNDRRPVFDKVLWNTWQKATPGYRHHSFEEHRLAHYTGQQQARANAAALRELHAALAPAVGAAVGRREGALASQQQARLAMGVFDRPRPRPPSPPALLAAPRGSGTAAAAAAQTEEAKATGGEERKLSPQPPPQLHIPAAAAAAASQEAQGHGRGTPTLPSPRRILAAHAPPAARRAKRPVSPRRRLPSGRLASRKTAPGATPPAALRPVRGLGEIRWPPGRSHGRARRARTGNGGGRKSTAKKKKKKAVAPKKRTRKSRTGLVRKVTRA